VSGFWSARQVRDAAVADNEALRRESAWYDERIREHDGDIAAIDARLAEAWTHLCAVLVPELDPARLEALALKLGLPAIGARVVEAGTRSELARQQGLRAAAGASPLYQNREGIRNECEIRIAECDELLAPLRAVYDVICRDPRFIRLRADGYATGHYNGRWWTLSYYRDWKEADELLESFGPAQHTQDFPALLHKVAEAEAAARTLQDDRDALAERLTQVQALEEQHDDAGRALDEMPQRRLAAVRGSVRAHLEPMTEDRLVTLVGDEHDVVVALQRISGLAAQRRYLLAAAQTYLLEPRAQLATAADRNRRDIDKLARPKNAGKRFEAAKMSKRFTGRPAAFVKRGERYGQTRAVVTSFHHYERGSLASDFLWWDVMSDGRLDGDFIPEVQTHRERHPEAEHAVAVAAVAERDDPANMADGLLMHDGS
jgi:hypothetical protein